MPAQHGTDRSEQVDVDTARFFRAVDRGVTEHVSLRSRLPLILAALPEHQGRFRQLSQNRALVEDGVRIDPGSVAPDELSELAWQAFKPHYDRDIARRRDAFFAARQRDAGSAEITEVARAAAEGRVSTLMLAAGHIRPGRLDRTTGAIRDAALSEPDVDDVLDDIGELVARYGGEVLIVDADQMPLDSMVAAIFRGASWS